MLRQQQWVRINPQLDCSTPRGIIPMKQEDQQKAIKLAFVNSVPHVFKRICCKALLDILNDKQRKFSNSFTIYSARC